METWKLDVPVGIGKLVEKVPLTLYDVGEVYTAYNDTEPSDDPRYVESQAGGTNVPPKTSELAGTETLRPASVMDFATEE